MEFFLSTYQIIGLINNLFHLLASLLQHLKVSISLCQFLLICLKYLLFLGHISLPCAFYLVVLAYSHAKVLIKLNGELWQLFKIIKCAIEKLLNHQLVNRWISWNSKLCRLFSLVVCNRISLSGATASIIYLVLIILFISH